MKTKAIQLFKKIELDSLPNGEYEGTWGGYVVKLIINEVDYELQTQRGIRTPKAPCKIIIDNGNITVEAIEYERPIKLPPDSKEPKL